MKRSMKDTFGNFSSDEEDNDETRETIEGHGYGSELDVIKKNFKLIQEEKMSELNDKIVAEGWAYIALVLDRIFLIVYSLIFVIGTVICLLTAPPLYDSRKPLSRTSAVN